MIKTKRVCKYHNRISNQKLVPCELLYTNDKKTGRLKEYCPKCKEEGTNYGTKTIIVSED